MLPPAPRRGCALHGDHRHERPLAAGCCRALAGEGLGCPQDVSVAGCGDLPLSGSVTPPLTTVKLPQDCMGVQWHSFSWTG